MPGEKPTLPRHRRGGGGCVVVVDDAAEARFFGVDESKFVNDERNGATNQSENKRQHVQRFGAHVDGMETDEDR